MAGSLTLAAAELPAQDGSPAGDAGLACDVARFAPRAGFTGAAAELARLAAITGAAPLRPGFARRASAPSPPGLCTRAVLAFEPGGGAAPGGAGPESTAVAGGRAPAASAASLPWAGRFSPADSLERGGWPALSLLPVTTKTVYNSAYPRDRNNGALWAGRGLSTAVQGGVELRWGPLSAAVAPVLAWQQNRVFETVPISLEGLSSLNRPVWSRTLDWPQRMGPRAFRTVHPGDSYLRIDAGGVAAGVSTENLWWGPARHNPLLMSNTAAGFPHGYIGTSRPVPIGIGRLDVEAVWGRLAESDYFDKDPGNDRRHFSGLVLSFQPRGVPGLHLGAARAYLGVMPSEGLSPRDFIVQPYENLFVNADALGIAGLTDNVLLSIYARLVLPASGFEVYAEWAREDAWRDARDLVSEPDHSHGYTLGLEKAHPLGDGRWLRFYGEATRLRASRSFLADRQRPTFYIHGAIVQGYTHRGQLLGAAIGPGSSADIIGADLFSDWGRIGVFAERVYQDDEAYYRVWHEVYGVRDRRDTELSVGLRHLHFIDRFEIASRIAYSHRENRDFLQVREPEPRIDRNLGIELVLTWRP